MSDEIDTARREERYTYEDAIEAAGFNLIDLIQVGDYQGSYIARVEGGWLLFSYGSCGGCDSIEAFNGYEMSVPPYSELVKAAPGIVGDLLTDAEIIHAASGLDGSDYYASRGQKEALAFVYGFIPRGNA